MVNKLLTICGKIISNPDTYCVLISPIVLFFIETLDKFDPLYTYFIGVLIITGLDIVSALLANYKELEKSKFNKVYLKLGWFLICLIGCAVLDLVLSTDMPLFSNFYLSKFLCTFHMIRDIYSVFKHAGKAGYNPAKSMINLLNKNLPKDITEHTKENEDEQEKN